MSETKKGEVMSTIGQQETYATPKLIIDCEDISSEEVKKAYQLLGVLQNRSPYNSQIRLVINHEKNSFCGNLKISSSSFSTSFTLESSSFEELLADIRTSSISQLKSWKKDRF